MITASTAVTIVTAAIIAAAGLLGVIAGIFATARRERLARQGEAKRALNVAALSCLARVSKIDAAVRGTHEGAQEDRNQEINHLGKDLDGYVVAIAGVEDRATRTRHWEIYERMVPILIGHDTENLRSTIEALEQIRGELMEADSRKLEAAAWLAARLLRRDQRRETPAERRVREGRSAGRR
jgi:hypothetical protein